MAAGILRHHGGHTSKFRAAVSVGLLHFVMAANADCVDDAAAYQHVNPLLVRAIISVESNYRPYAVNINSNGSEDVGLMQINSSNFPALARYGISRAALFDACTNVYVGTWILAQKIARFGLTWDAIGAYNASSQSLRLRYARKVFDKLIKFSLGTSVVSSVSPADVEPQGSAPRVPSMGFHGPVTASPRYSAKVAGAASFIPEPSIRRAAAKPATTLAVYEQPVEQQ